MVRGRRGLKNPRQKAIDILTAKGWSISGSSIDADVLATDDIRVVIDYGEHTISWLVPERSSQWLIGRILRFDPVLSGDEIADMAMEGAVDIGRREAVRE